MRKIPLSIPLPDRSDFAKTAGLASSLVRSSRSWLAKAIEPKQAPKADEKVDE